MSLFEDYTSEILEGLRKPIWRIPMEEPGIDLWHWKCKPCQEPLIVCADKNDNIHLYCRKCKGTNRTDITSDQLKESLKKFEENGFQFEIVRP